MKQSFRVKGLLDNHPIAQTALLPAGDGAFILPINAAMRKGIGKKQELLSSYRWKKISRPIR